MGTPFWQALKQEFAIETVVAVGNVAHRSLQRSGLDVPKIRHPAHGGRSGAERGVGVLQRALDLRALLRLVHLRLTVSASELALLPFEFAKVPVGPNATAEGWLALQTRPPVALTRHIRNVSAESVVWPHRPRILFVAGDPDVIPFVEHRAALLQAIGPFAFPGRDDPVKSADDLEFLQLVCGALVMSGVAMEVAGSRGGAKWVTHVPRTARCAPSRLVRRIPQVL